MRKQWLRGILLGVSLAFLLAGGVALAQNISIDPYCNVCCDDCFGDPPECEGFEVSSAGWAADEMLDQSVTSPGPYGSVACGDCLPADGDGRAFLQKLYMMCPECPPRDKAEVLNNHIVAIFEPLKPGDYGEWTLELGGTAGKVVGHFYLAEDAGVCPAAEFVPEPGTIALLGTGLMGLAGYATLRWRRRE